MINYDLKCIRAIIFDIDGVLSTETVGMDQDGMPLRTINIKDGYAIQLAQKMGLRIAIMTGGTDERIRRRYEYLGVEDIHLQCSVKLKTYEAFREKYDLDDAEVIFMGDDIPDLEVMQRVGCPCSPSDACAEVKAVSCYVSQRLGGHGCARDVIEQVLQAQGKWMMDRKAFGW
ncbi:MAG: HAD family hydrolase [Prevotella sp.]|nr:HAD hydrolase-like protein [Prevotella sp.]